MKKTNNSKSIISDSETIGRFISHNQINKVTLGIKYTAFLPKYPRSNPAEVSCTKMDGITENRLLEIASYINPNFPFKACALINVGVVRSIMNPNGVAIDVQSSPIENYSEHADILIKIEPSKLHEMTQAMQEIPYLLKLRDNSLGFHWDNIPIKIPDLSKVPRI